jgi:hypothetical protein
MNRTGITHFASVGLMAALFILVAQPIAAQGGAPTKSGVRGYEYTGVYGQFGVAVGEINFDLGDSDSDASGGFTMTGGYRFLPWLSAEANFTYLGGGDVEINNTNVGEGQFFAFTFGPKFYPLGAFKVEAIPERVQPYGLIGIGGGEFDIDDSGFDDESSFIARFILGIDFWATDHIGLFVEGGGHAASESDVDGVGIFTVGGQYRF